MNPKSGTNPRSAGIVIFLIGLAVGVWQIVLPILGALQGAPNVSYYTEMVALAPLSMIIGLIMIFSGPEGPRWLSGPPSTVKIIAILAGVAVIAVISVVGMNYIMKSLGYS